MTEDSLQWWSGYPSRY